MNKSNFLLLIFTAFMMLCSTDTFACSCALPLPTMPLKQQVEVARKDAKAIFVGQVLEIDDKQYKFGTVIKFQVEKSWKQIRSKEIYIVTGRGGGDCGFPFAIGMKYLVYAYGPNNGKFGTGICSRTKRISENEAEKIESKLLGKEIKLHKNAK